MRRCLTNNYSPSDRSIRKAKAEDCKAIPRHAVRRCITNNYSPSDRRKNTASPKATERYHEKTHFPHLQCSQAKYHQTKFGGAKPDDLLDSLLFRDITRYYILRCEVISYNIIYYIAYYIVLHIIDIIFIFEEAGPYHAHRGAGTSIFGTYFSKKKHLFSLPTALWIQFAHSTHNERLRCAPHRNICAHFWLKRGLSVA